MAQVTVVYRLIKEKITITQIGDKLYRKTEKTEEIVNAPVIDYIDLTRETESPTYSCTSAACFCGFERCVYSPTDLPYSASDVNSPPPELIDLTTTISSPRFYGYLVNYSLSPSPESSNLSWAENVHN